MKQNAACERVPNDWSKLCGGPRPANGVQRRSQDTARARGAEVVLEQGVTKEAEKSFGCLIDWNPASKSGADNNIEAVDATSVSPKRNWSGGVHPKVIHEFQIHVFRLSEQAKTHLAMWTAISGSVYGALRVHQSFGTHSMSFSKAVRSGDTRISL